MLEQIDKSMGEKTSTTINSNIYKIVVSGKVGIINYWGNPGLLLNKLCQEKWFNILWQSLQ